MEEVLEERKTTYPPSWVVMQNNIQECFKSMNIDEKRMLILASPIARTTNAKEKDKIIITAEDFAKESGIKTHSAYKQLEVASKNLIKRSFSYNNERGKRVLSNWVIDCTYDDGGIAIRFPEVVLFMLKEFDKINPYTKYKKDIVLKLKKDYSFDLYHLAKKHQAMGHFEMSLEHLKSELGLPKSYDKLCNLKDRVLKPSLDEICTSTDITLAYENIKKGRSVVGFKFKVKEKPQIRIADKQEQDTKTLDMFFNMSDAQINMYGNQLASLDELGSMANAGETTSNFAARIKRMLKDPKQQAEFHTYLKRLGFSSKR